jgi:Zn finger protein HypA/HybF involved in hydrogenase expression
MKEKLTTQVFIQKSVEAHGNLYDYSKAVYKNQSTKVEIGCKIHGTFYQYPQNHYSKPTKCPKCSTQKTCDGQRKTLSTFIRESQLVHDNFYTYDKAIYTTARKLLTITCPDHGDFQQLPTNHLKGVGCPSCHGGPYCGNKPTTLYYLSINNGEAYKIGLTCKGVRARFGPHDINKLEVLNTWEFPTGLEAYKVEQDILKKFSMFKYTGPMLLLSGNTELFVTDIFKIMNIPINSTLNVLINTMVNI